MDNRRLSGILYIAGGIFFLISSFIGGNFLLLPLGIFLIVVGLMQMRKQD